MKQHIFSTGLFLAVILAGCAQQGNPVGGPKDETPPVVVNSEPENYSRLFKAEKVNITFDEYIVLDNVNQELIVSPPLEDKPVVKLKGKTLVIEIPGELHENTTYTFNFGNSIKDLHEGNKLQNFEYVFSTGETLDSLSVKGTLKYAFDQKAPEEPMYIMLYGDLRDSIPLIEPPFYVGRSDDEGNFSVNNLRPDVYKVFALKDANNNLLFDLPTEEIAFLDSNLIVSAEFFRSIIEASDTIQTDSLVINQEPGSEIAADSVLIKADTLEPAYKKYNSIFIDLSVFTEEQTSQYLSDYSRKDRRHLDIIFSQAVTDSFAVRALQNDFPENWFITQMNPGKDTLALWIPDSLIYKRDTISTLVSYMVEDSLQNPVKRTDTLSFVFRMAPSKNKKPDVQKSDFSISTISKGGQQELNKTLSFTGSVPVRSSDAGKITLYSVVDSLETPVQFEILKDSMRIDRYFLKTEWGSETDYHLFVLPEAFTSIFGQNNDTIDIRFKAKDIESYGNLTLNLENITCPIIVELYAGKKLIRTVRINKQGPLLFDYLPPQKYSVKFILDLNDNGKWDSGKYLDKRQPEKVEFFPKEIEVRSNWDINEAYKFKED